MTKNLRLWSLALSIALVAVPAAAGKKPVKEGPPLPPYQEDDKGVVYFETVHEIPGAERDQLLEQAEEWVGESFADEDVKELLADPERGWLTFDTLTMSTWQ